MHVYCELEFAEVMLQDGGGETEFAEVTDPESIIILKIIVIYHFFILIKSLFVNVLLLEFQIYYPFTIRVAFLNIYLLTDSNKPCWSY
jgi:hypothetical protein